MERIIQKDIYVGTTLNELIGVVEELDTVILKLRLIDGTNIVNPSNQTIKLYARRSDGEIIEQTTQITKDNEYTTIILLDSILSIHGIVAFNLKLTDINGTISSQKFGMKVKSIIYSAIAENELEALENITGELSNLQEQIYSNDNDILNLQEQIYSNDTDISNLQKQLESSDVSILQSKVSTNTSNISSLQSQVSTNTSDIADLKSQSGTGTNYDVYITPRMTNDNVQSAIDLAVSSGINKVMLEGKTYILTDTLLIPSKFELCGTKSSTILQLTEVDKPVIEHTGDVLGKTVIRDLIIKGDNSTSTTTSTLSNNDGIKINDYYSVIDNVEISGCGGKGINWHTNNVTGSIVENTISNVIVRKCIGDSFYLGDANNNKITDGFLTNCISYGTTNNRALHIGSSAGWQINGLHTYGHGACDGVICIRNAFSTCVDNIYIEDFKGRGLQFSQVQKNLTISNIVGNVKDNGTQQFLYFSHSSVFTYSSNVVVNNVAVDCANTGTTYIFDSDGSKLNIVASNISLGGNYIPTELYNNTNLEGKIKIIDNNANSEIIPSTLNSPIYYTFDISGSNTITHEITIPSFTQNSTRLARLTIVANENYNGSEVLYYSAEIFIGMKTSTGKVKAKQLVTTTGFITDPTFEITSDGILTISYRPSNSAGYGRATFELFV